MDRRQRKPATVATVRISELLEHKLVSLGKASEMERKCVYLLVFK